MKKITALFKNITKTSIAPSPAPIVQEQDWKDSGHFQYIMNTLKVRYKSKSGRITLEDVSPNEVVNIIKQASDQGASPLAQAFDASGTPSPIEISVCAMMIEENGSNRRVRAIPNAAHLRLINLNTPAIDVYFEHLGHRGAPRDDVTPSSLAPINGSKKYGGQSMNIDLFFQVLSRVNNENNLYLQSNAGISKQNFDEIFTQNEIENMKYLF